MSKAVIDRLMHLIDGPRVPDRTRRDLVEALYPASYRIGTSIVTSTVNGIVLAAIMHHWLPLAWMAVALAICLWRTVDCKVDELARHLGLGIIAFP